MSKHAAPKSDKSRAIEAVYAYVFGTATPDRNGKHRAVEAFNPMTGTYTSFEAAK